MPAGAAYSAFLSYARADEDVAQWLVRYLENLWVAAPKLTRPFRRVFRDADELGASHSLGDTLKLRLDQSERLIVLLSEASLKSRWVTEEIDYFRSQHPSRPIFALVVGEPGLRGRSVTAWAQSILGEDHAGHPLLLGPEPAAPDVTSEGRKVAARRLAAGMLNVSYDTLAQRRTRASILFGGALALVLGFVGVGAYFGQPALAAYEAMQAQRSAEAEFVLGLDEAAYDEAEAARILACCQSLVERAPVSTRDRIHQMVRDGGLLRGPMQTGRPSLAGHNAIASLDSDLIVASGGAGFVVLSPDDIVLSGGGNVTAIGWDAESRRLFTISPGFNFQGASIQAYSLSDGPRAAGRRVIPVGNLDLSAESTRILAASGVYAYFLDTETWRVARMDMRNGSIKTGNAGRPTRADTTPDGRIVRFGSGTPDENLLVDMADGRHAADIHGVMTNFGVIAHDFNRVFRFDTWSWSEVVDRGEAPLDGYEGLVSFSDYKTTDTSTEFTTGAIQVRCPRAVASCERTTVFSTPHNPDQGSGWLSDDHRLLVVANRAYDLATHMRIASASAAHLFLWREGREVLGVTPRWELISWDMDPALDVRPEAASRRICQTTMTESISRTIGNRTFTCQ